jgi:hypothetical protein
MNKKLLILHTLFISRIANTTLIDFSQNDNGSLTRESHPTLTLSGATAWAAKSAAVLATAVLAAAASNRYSAAS